LLGDGFGDVQSRLVDAHGSVATVKVGHYHYTVINLLLIDEVDGLLVVCHVSQLLIDVVELS